MTYDNVWWQVSGGDHRKEIIGKFREISDDLKRPREVVSHEVNNHFKHTVMFSIVPLQL